MELNIPIRAVKQKPIANMDFMRTCRENSRRRATLKEARVDGAPQLSPARSCPRLAASASRCSAPGLLPRRRTGVAERPDSGQSVKVRERTGLSKGTDDGVRPFRLSAPASGPEQGT